MCRFEGKFEAEGGRAGPGGKVDAPELSSGPVCEIQEVSRLGAQGVTAKSKLLAREMPRVCSEAFVSWRPCWSCDLEVWVRNVGRLAPSTFPPTEAGGLAHLGSRRLPRMRSLADEITAAATRKRCTGVQDEGACARRQRMH